MLKRTGNFTIQLLLCVCSLLFACKLRSQVPGFLSVKDRSVVDGNGRPFILRGMGLGGWMLQEGYMFKLSNLGQQYRIREKIQDVIGVEKTAQFYDRWLHTHTTRRDLDSMAAWGFNSIRLPMHFGLYTLPVDQEPVAGKQTWIETGFALTDSLLQWCEANKMYLILDLHAAPGGQGNDLPISDRNASKPSLWQSRANQEKTIALWKKLAERYAGKKWIGGYDIINEPNWGFEDSTDTRGTNEKKNAPLRSLMMEITSAIRSVDKNHIIIIEGNGFGNNYRGIYPKWDDNLVMSFHKYGNFNNTKAIQHFLDWSEQNNIPLWLGESGENSNTWFTEAISLVESHGIGWAWWQSKKMNINEPMEIKIPEGYGTLLDYWSGRGPKPTEDAAWKILQQLLQNISIENNIVHRDVIDAMFRQVRSASAIPFREHVIESNTIIQAADFDLGRQRVAYYDRDSASYQYTPGVNTRGNKGYSYRNDGVDIRYSEKTPVVFSTEAGEWLQYTVRVPIAGKYKLSFETMADSTGGILSFLNGASMLINELTIPVTKNEWQWTGEQELSLPAGERHLRVFIKQGGFNLKNIRFVRL